MAMNSDAVVAYVLTVLQSAPRDGLNLAIEALHDSYESTSRSIETTLNNPYASDNTKTMASIRSHYIAKASLNAAMDVEAVKSRCVRRA